MIDYTSLRSILPELPRPHDGYALIFVGYDYCPYSKKVFTLIDQYQIPKDKVYFYPINQMQSTQIKSTFHNRTFPLVFLHTVNDQIVHIGGASDLEDTIDSWKRNR